MSIKSPVHNRGVAPNSFLNTLVSWAASAPEEIFDPKYRGNELDVYEKFLYFRLKNPDRDFPLARYESDLYRRAVMCEVLRVLAGFESSWNQREGVDVTNPSSNTAATEEAGWFQCSTNSVNFHSSLKDLFNWWARKTDTSDWKNMDQSGKRFIEMTKEIPEYAIEHCARLLRFTIRHHGPLIRGEVFTHMNGDAIREFMDLIEKSQKPPTQGANSEPNTSTINTPDTMSKRYIIDPGHGGSDPGAMSFGFKESTIVLAVSIKLIALLEKDPRFIKPFMTRSADYSISLDSRADMANNLDAVLVSIHANSSNGSGTGFECFTSPGQTESDKLAIELLEAYNEELGDLLKGRYDTSDGDPDKEAKFAVLTKTQGTAVLFELGFIDNVNDRKLLTDMAMQDRMAHALYVGICGYEGMVPLDILVTPPVVVTPPLAPLPIPINGMLPADDPTHFEVCAKWLADGAESLRGEIITSMKEDGDPDLFGWSDFERVGFLERASEMLLNRAAGLKALRKL